MHWTSDAARALSTAALAAFARRVVGIEPMPTMLTHRRTTAPNASFVHYMLSEVNVDDAIARGAYGAEEAREWCSETLTPVFAAGDLTVLIPGYMATLARQ